MSGPAAGWYDDPQMANTRRYWDGAKWTDHRQEKPPTAATVTTKVESQGPVTAGIVFAFLIPFIGLLIGLALLGRRGNEGVSIIVLSVIGFACWYFVLAAT